MATTGNTRKIEQSSARNRRGGCAGIKGCIKDAPYIFSSKKGNTAGKVVTLTRELWSLAL